MNTATGTETIPEAVAIAHAGAVSPQRHGRLEGIASNLSQARVGAWSIIPYVLTLCAVVSAKSALLLCELRLQGEQLAQATEAISYDKHDMSKVCQRSEASEGAILDIKRRVQH